jgi:hypothetical protein
VLDLWREVGAHPPTTDLMDVLAQARSNEPRLGTGADVFRRVAGERVTPAVAVAGTAFGALVAAASVDEVAPPPGFAVQLSALGPPEAEMHGQAVVVHARSGTETVVGFTASYDGGTHFECLADGQRITLEDLDEATGRPLRLAALDRFAERPATPASCRAALELAVALGPLSPMEADALGAGFADMLLELLRSPPVGDAAWEVAAELLERADLGRHGDEAQLAEDLVWDLMSGYLDSNTPPPRGLRALADRLRLAPDGDTAAEVVEAVK